VSGPGPGPAEEELRAYEEQLSRISVPDMLAQSAVTLLNLAARQLPQGPGAEGGDLEQARDGIDAAAALLAILERRMPQEVRPLRDALSQLQMGYAAAVKAAAGEGSRPEPAAGGGEQAARGGSEQEPPAAAGAEGEEHRPGPAESSGRLWVPGR
jgi:hypothetical protein